MWDPHVSDMVHGEPSSPNRLDLGFVDWTRGADTAMIGPTRVHHVGPKAEMAGDMGDTLAQQRRWLG